MRLLEATRMRVGNEEYARENDSFGLTTRRVRQQGETRAVDSADVNGDIKGAAAEALHELGKDALSRAIARPQAIAAQAAPRGTHFAPVAQLP